MPLDFEDLAHPPESVGKGKLILLGIILPAVIAYWAAQAWIHETAYWPGRGTRGVNITGEAARYMAVCYLSVAAFVHARWFWGALQFERVFKVGIVSTMIVGLIAGLTAFCLAMA